MKRLFILGLFCLQGVYGNQLFKEYFSYTKQLELPSGNYREGEIEIIMDPQEILRIQKVQENRLFRKGFSEEEAKEFSRVGVVREDQYLVWLRDAVYFPNAVPGTYDRVIWKSELKGASAGVAVLPVLPSGKVVLNLNYRHATRSWELELPRGGIEAKETIQEAAVRELKEETGLIPSSVTFLGEMVPDSGILSAVIPVFIGEISGQQESSPEYSEAIAGVISFEKDEIKKGLTQGYLEVPVQGKKKKVPLRDSFLTFALLQAELRGLW